MNRTQRMNRPKRLRLAAEASGSAAATANHKPDIAKLAADKTPSYKRIGNYYAKTKQGKHNTYFNVVPKHKLKKVSAIPNVFAKVWENIKQKFGFNKYAVS